MNATSSPLATVFIFNLARAPFPVIHGYRCALPSLDVLTLDDGSEKVVELGHDGLCDLGTRDTWDIPICDRILGDYDFVALLVCLSCSSRHADMCHCNKRWSDFSQGRPYGQKGGKGSTHLLRLGRPSSFRSSRRKTVGRSLQSFLGTSLRSESRSHAGLFQWRVLGTLRLG